MDFNTKPVKPNQLLEVPDLESYYYNAAKHESAIARLVPLDVIKDPLKAGRLFTRDSFFMCRAFNWNVTVDRDFPFAVKIIPNGDFAPTLLVKDYKMRPMVSNIIVASFFYGWAGRVSGIWDCCPDASQFERLIPIRYVDDGFDPQAVVGDTNCPKHWYEALVFTRLFYHAWNIFRPELAPHIREADRLHPELKPLLDKHLANKPFTSFGGDADMERIADKRFITLTDEEYAPLIELMLGSNATTNGHPLDNKPRKREDRQ